MNVEISPVRNKTVDVYILETSLTFIKIHKSTILMNGQ